MHSCLPSYVCPVPADISIISHDGGQMKEAGHLKLQTLFSNVYSIP